MDNTASSPKIPEPPATDSAFLAPAGFTSRVSQLMQRIAGIGWISYNLDNHTFTIDSKLLPLFGLPSGASSHFTMQFCLEKIHPEDKVLFQKIFKGEHHHVDPVDYEFRTLLDGGGVAYLKCIMESFGEEPTSTGLITGLVMDVTEQRRREKFSRLELELAVALNSTRTLTETLKFSTEVALEISGGDGGGIYLVNPVTHDFELAWQTGFDSEFITEVALIRADTPNGRLAHQGLPLYTDYKQIMEQTGNIRPSSSLKAVAILPILHRDEVIGCLNLASFSQDIIPHPARPTLESVAGRLGQNISEARILASLKEREENLTLLFESSPDMLVVFDYNQSILRINKNAASKLGYQMDQITGESLLIVHPTQYHGEVRQSLQRLTDEESLSFAIPLITRTGRWIKVDTQISRIVWENRPAFIASSRDITSKLETEEMIRATADLFYSLGSDPFKNMEAIVKRSCQILGGVAALYNRLDDQSQSLVVWAGYDLPADMPLSDDPSGHICYEAAICGNNSPVILENLEHTVFFESDPNVKKYGLKAYLGHPISLRKVNVGSLAVVFDIPKAFNNEEINTIITLARALSLEEERLSAIKALEGSEALYRSVIEQMTDLFYRTDKEGIVILASPSALKVAGALNMDEIIGKPITNFWKYPEKRAELIQLIHENGHVSDYRLEMVRVDGSEATVSVSSHFRYDEEGSFSGIEGIIRDVTERIHQERALRESEEKFRLIAENTSDGILILSSTGTIEYVSPAYEKQSGYAANEKTGLGAEQIFQLLHPDDREAVFGKVYQAISAKETDLVYNFRTLRKNGEYYFREDHAHFKYDEAGNHEKTYVTCRDITERHLAHLELVKAKEKAEESDSLKSSFLANISHEIRTPLNGILGFAEVLKTPGLGNHETRECIDIINASSHQLLGIINDIVEISKIETRQARLSLTTFPVTDVLRNVFHSFKPDLSDKNLVFNLHTDNLPPRLSVTTDQTKLQQIITNLTDNALKFTERGSVELGAYHTKDDDSITFYVRDTGPGIRKSDQEIIFERFRQLDQSLARVKGGTGLGLTICKAFAELLGSTINIQSEPGKGSQFSVKLPAALVSCAGEEADDSKEPVVSRYPDLQGQKVLVVDDEDTNMRYLSVLLRRSNATIVKAVNGLQAMELFDLHRDLLMILLDIKMPGMNGLDVAREIRKSNKTIPVVAQTACAMSEEKQAALKAGCSDYITKPISEAVFLSVLRRYA